MKYSLLWIVLFLLFRSLCTHRRQRRLVSRTVVSSMVPVQPEDELKARVATAVNPREAAVDVMKELQRHYGWLTDEAVGEAAELLGLVTAPGGRAGDLLRDDLPPAGGKGVIHVCDSISCWSAGYETIIDHVRNGWASAWARRPLMASSPSFRAAAWAIAAKARP